jgi:hypothetical protein
MAKGLLLVEQSQWALLLLFGFLDQGGLRYFVKFEDELHRLGRVPLRVILVDLLDAAHILDYVFRLVELDRLVPLKHKVSFSEPSRVILEKWRQYKRTAGILRWWDVFDRKWMDRWLVTLISRFHAGERNLVIRNLDRLTE